MKRHRSNEMLVYDMLKRESNEAAIFAALRRRYPKDDPTLVKQRMRIYIHQGLKRIELGKKDPEIKPNTPKFLKFIYNYDLRASIEEKVEDCTDSWTVFVNCARNLAHAVHPTEGFILRAKLPSWCKGASDNWIRKHLTERLFKHIIF